MKEIGFTRSTVDECIFYRGQTMYVLYTYDSILGGTDQEEIDQIVEDLKRAKFILSVEGDLKDFLRVNIERQVDVTINLTQQHLIYNIVTDLHLSN